MTKIKTSEGQELEFRDKISIRDARLVDFDKVTKFMKKLQAVKDIKEEIPITNEDMEFLIDMIEKLGQKLLIVDFDLLSLPFTDITIIATTIMTTMTGTNTQPSKNE